MFMYLFIVATLSGMWDLVPPLGTEPVPPAVEVDHWTSREVLERSS